MAYKLGSDFRNVRTDIKVKHIISLDIGHSSF